MKDSFPGCRASYIVAELRLWRGCNVRDDMCQLVLLRGDALCIRLNIPHCWLWLWQRLPLDSIHFKKKPDVLECHLLLIIEHVFLLDGNRESIAGAEEGSRTGGELLSFIQIVLFLALPIGDLRRRIYHFKKVWFMAINYLTIFEMWICLESFFRAADVRLK